MPKVQGVMEMRSRNVVPGEASRGASLEGPSVMCEVDNNHTPDLWWDPVCLARTRGRIWPLMFEYILEFGFGTVPDSFGEAFGSWNNLLEQKRGGGEAHKNFLVTW